VPLVFNPTPPCMPLRKTSRRCATLAVASVLVLAMTSIHPALAQTARPETQATAQAPALGFHERVLPNGLRVFTARDTNSANVTVHVWYQVGAKDDPEGRSGFAHMFEHLMFQSTRNLPAGAFINLTADVGGSGDAMTHPDLTFFFDTAPTQHLERLLFAEADRMGSLVVDDETFTREREVVKEEMRQRTLATPYGRFERLQADAFVYQTHPYRRPGLGSIEDLDAATTEEVRRFHETFYRPDNAFLIVAGNFDQAQLDRWIDQYFGPIQRPNRPIPRHEVVETWGGARDGTFYAPNVPAPMVQISWPGVAYGHPDRVPLEVLSVILSSGSSARLQQALVRPGLAATATSNIPAMQQAGEITITATLPAGGEPDAVLDAIRVEAARLRNEPVTAAELAGAQARMRATSIRSRETADARAFEMGFALSMTGDPTVPDRDQVAIQAVTVEDLQRVARQYVTDDRAISMRYLLATEDHPETSAPGPFSAPLLVADLAAAGEPTMLAPEAERAPIPEPGRSVIVETPQIVERTLSNGLRVVVAPRPGVGMVSARLSLGAGGADAPEGQAGVAVLTAGLLTKGAGGRTALEVAAEIERLGVDWRAVASADFVQVNAFSTADVFPRTLALMADAVRRPDLAPDEVEREKAAQIGRLGTALSQPAQIASMVALRLVFGDAPYGGHSMGTPTSVADLTREDVAAFHAQRYRPDGAVLVLSGDITPDAAYALAEQTFGDWAGKAPAIDAGNLAGPPLPARIVVVDQPGAGQAMVMAVSRSVARQDPDYFPVLMTNAVLGGGFTSRLSSEIRTKRGLSYAAGSAINPRLGSGSLYASAQTKNETAVEVAGLILDEITRLPTAEVTEAELAGRKTMQIGIFGRSAETVDGLGSLIINMAAYDAPLSGLADYARDIDSVTPEQVQAAAAEHLSPDGVSLVIVGDASVFAADLRARYPGVEVVPLTALNLDSSALL